MENIYYSQVNAIILMKMSRNVLKQPEDSSKVACTPENLGELRLVNEITPLAKQYDLFAAANFTRIILRYSISEFRIQIRIYFVLWHLILNFIQ